MSKEQDLQAVKLKQLAERRQVLSGEIAFSELSRLTDHEYMHSQQLKPACSYEAKFSYDYNKQLFMQLTVQAELKLICQRCLQVFDHKVELAHNLYPVEDVYLSKRDCEIDSGSMVELENGILNLLQTIEDELLLAIPYAVSHSGGECGRVAPHVEQKSNNPFAVLKGLEVTP